MLIDGIGRSPPPVPFPSSTLLLSHSALSKWSCSVLGQAGAGCMQNQLAAPVLPLVEGLLSACSDYLTLLCARAELSLSLALSFFSFNLSFLFLTFFFLSLLHTLSLSFTPSSALLSKPYGHILPGRADSSAA